MRRMIALVLSAALALSLTACGADGEKAAAGSEESAAIGGDPATLEPDVKGEADSDGVQIPSPITKYDSLEEAAAAAGFSMAVPETIDGHPEQVYQVYNVGTENVLLEVIYHGGLEAESTVHIRKAPGSEDISGDYNQYSESETLAVGDREVTMKGDDGQVHLATWTLDGYTYSVAAYAETGVSSDELVELVAQVQ